MLDKSNRVCYNEITKGKEKEIKKMKNYTYTREATTEEIRDYELIEKLTARFDDDEFSEIVDMLGEYFLNYGEARKAAYPKVYRFAKKLGVTVKALDNWYFTEVC